MAYPPEYDPGIYDEEGPHTLASRFADFALELLRRTTASNVSIVLSPASISVSLAMIAVGAAGKTKDQIYRAFAYGMNYEEAKERIRSLVDDSTCNTADNSSTLLLANILHVQHHETFEFKEPFTTAVKEQFATVIVTGDENSSSKIAEEINKKVEDATNSKLAEIIDAQSLIGSCSVTLINAIYFKADWKYKFKEDETFDETFHVSENNVIEVKMMPMYAYGRFRYTEDSYVQLLGMPYDDSETFMYIFLPRFVYGLAEVEKVLNGRKMLNLIAESEIVDIEVAIPKFKIENSFALGDTLKEVGITDAFAEQADFSAMANIPLHLDDAVHKTFIQVSENGTEATASTKVQRPPPARALWQGGHLRFIADHPFLFAIVKSNHTMLFIGRLA